eukprot:CAMPEP_0118638604 /NCGR_PEP_ID=MMETSP0785-20121206/3780_1 /TAXON_ID=91992 /ORGANISM="Bolidomonas pacifica, Strain CCMP 1866" /LENGTH=648 /DNA_ID=CAMNT_0006529879 /DNA_START=11 /DNA_END=1953 /DNA_ORIENTATION=-
MSHDIPCFDVPLPPPSPSSKGRIVYASGYSFYGTVPSGSSGIIRTTTSPTSSSLKFLSATCTTLIAVERGGDGAGDGDGDKVFITGTPQSGVQYRSPTSLPMPRSVQVTSLSSGRYHTVLTTSLGTVMSWGSGHFGQLGLGDDAYRVNPTLVSGINTIMESYPGYNAKAVTAGGNHSIVHLEGGEGDVLLSFGFNSSGQCGIGSYYNTVMAPSFVRGFEPWEMEGRSRLPPPLPGVEGFVVATTTRPSSTSDGKNGIRVQSIAAGLNFSVVSTDRSVVYAFGNGKGGKLGVSKVPPTGEREKSRKDPSKKDCACSPIPIRFPRGVQGGQYDLECGAEFAFSTCTDTRGGVKCYSWGIGGDGQHAMNCHLHLRTPRENQHIQQIARASGEGAETKIFARGSSAGRRASKREEEEFEEFEGPPGLAAWEGRSFESGHNIYYPKLVNFDRALSEYFGDVPPGLGYDVVGCSMGETGIYAILDIVEGERRRPFEIPVPAEAKEEGGAVDSSSQYKASSPLRPSRSFDLLQDPSISLSKPPPRVVEQAHSWCRNGRIKDLNEILERGYNVKAKDAAGNDLLVVCCQNGSVAMARNVIRRGGDVNSCNKAGNTPLHFAMYFKHEEVVSLLQREGADDEKVNNEGLTCYEGLRKA